MPEDWTDPCTAALNNVNDRIYNARGNNRLAGSGGQELSEGDGDKERSIRALESDNKRLRDQITRLERILARHKIVEIAETESPKVLSELVP